MSPNEDEYRTEPMDSSPPAYPPRAETSAEAGAAEGTMTEDVEHPVADREVPRAVADTPADVANV